MELFGFNISRKKKQEDSDKNLQSFAPPIDEDGAINVTVGAFGASTVFSYEGTTRTDRDLINKYRMVAIQPEAEMAIDDIVNEAIVQDGLEPVMKLNMDNVELSDSIKNKIEDEFDVIKRLLNMENRGSDIFRRWYIDGRIYFHMMVDEKHPEEGIKESRAIDPRTIKKVKEIQKKLNPQTGITEVKTREYYVYSDEIIPNTGSNSLYSSQPGAASATVSVTPSVICYSHSGLVDNMTNLVVSHLHRALKVFNQLKMLEDATVIYTMVRAPERRVFYIDVGNLPKIKAEEYMKSLMNTYRNRIVYDASTGEIADDRRHMHMMEDFWMPRREGGKGTEISTLAGGNAMGDTIKQVEYFQKKFYQALNVPSSRLQSEGGFNIGRSSEISRDELKFSKYIQRLRNRFNDIFLQHLKYQLILKKIISEEDWDEFKDDIQFVYNTDMYFSQLKGLEILNEKMSAVALAEPYVGRYFSREYVQKNILFLTEEERDEENAKIKGEVGEGLGTAGGFEESPAKKPEPKIPGKINSNGKSGTKDFPKPKSNKAKAKDEKNNG